MQKTRAIHGDQIVSPDQPREDRRVRVYRNLHKGCLSVQERQQDGRWIVTGHVDQITLENVEFKVSQAGRRRVLETRRKNVHAVIEGDVIAREQWGSIATHAKGGEVRPVGYNPYVVEEFSFCDAEGPQRGEGITSVAAAEVTTRGAVAFVKGGAVTANHRCHRRHVL